MGVGELRIGRGRRRSVVGLTAAVLLLAGIAAGCNSSRTYSSAAFCTVANQVLAANRDTETGGPAQRARSATQVDQLKRVAPRDAIGPLGVMQSYLRDVDRGVKPTASNDGLDAAQRRFSDVLERECGVRGVVVPIP